MYQAKQVGVVLRGSAEAHRAQNRTEAGIWDQEWPGKLPGGQEKDSEVHWGPNRG